MEKNTNSLVRLRSEQSKNNENRLKEYLITLKYFPEVNEHFTIAKGFEVNAHKTIFRQEAIRRFISKTYSEPTTSATIEKLTGIKQKYLCELKYTLEKQNRIKVVALGQCPTTKSRGVQFLSSNPNIWDSGFVLRSNQLDLF